MSGIVQTDEDVDPNLYIADFAEMVRELMRAIAADDHSGPLSSASRRLRNLVAHADRLPASLSWYKILEGAVNKLKPPHQERLDYEHEYDDLSRKCLKYLAELTTSDGLSTARTSKARQAISEEIQYIPKRRELNRMDFNPEK